MNATLVFKSLPEGTTAAELADYLYRTIGLEIPLDSEHIVVEPRPPSSIGFVTISKAALAKFFQRYLFDQPLAGKIPIIEPAGIPNRGRQPNSNRWVPKGTRPLEGKR